VTNVIGSKGQPLDIDALRALVDGEAVAPGEPGWDEARRAWNLAVDQQPAAVVLAESADDVAAVVRFAVSHGLRVTPQGPGHFASTVGPLDDTILLKTTRMRGLEIDVEGRRARAEAGVLWIEVAEAAGEHGLAGLAGSSPDVGVVGYTLGGGMGWLARTYGLAANSVLAVELVTADGRRVRADATTNPDLFWAVRGGGGSFGVVTAIEFALYPVREVYAGILFFPVERAAEVLNAWREWIEDVPDGLTSVGRLLQIPPIPEIPEPLRGNSFVVVEAAFLGSEADGAELLAPLRELGPAIDTFATIPASALSTLHMDPDHPVPGIGDGMMLADLTPETVEALVEAAGPGSGSPLVSVELRHLGGALAQPAPGQGAVGTIDAGFAMFAVGIPMTPEIGAAVESHVELVKAALAPWDAGRSYFNFTERVTDGSGLYPEETYARLRALRAELDPGELFRVSHAIASGDVLEDELAA
jgi:hypothetical protein